MGGMKQAGVLWLMIISNHTQEGFQKNIESGDNMKDFDYSLEPINRTAGNVVSQKGCSDDLSITIDGTRATLRRLKNRQEVLKEKMGITPSQLHNRKRARIGKQNRYTVDGVLFRELLENGLKIKELCEILHKLKQERNKVDNPFSLGK